MDGSHGWYIFRRHNTQEVYLDDHGYDAEGKIMVETQPEDVPPSMWWVILVSGAYLRTSSFSLSLLSLGGIGRV